MTQLLLNVDAAAVDWARAQFALTAIYHWLFVPLTLGLAVIMGIAETCYYKTRKAFWRDTARFWQRLSHPPRKPIAPFCLLPRQVSLIRSAA